MGEDEKTKTTIEKSLFPTSTSQYKNVLEVTAALLKITHQSTPSKLTFKIAKGYQYDSYLYPGLQDDSDALFVYLEVKTK